MKDHDHPHTHEHHHDHSHDHDHHHDHSNLHESKTRWVVILTIGTMILEIGFGYYANSMALTAEGWHMSTHVFAIGLTFLAYFFSDVPIIRMKLVVPLDVKKPKE